MIDKMTIEEMRKTYEDEYVLIVDWEDDDSGWIARGRVVAHSRDRDDVYREMEARDESCAVEYLGDDDPVIML